MCPKSRPLLLQVRVPSEYLKEVYLEKYTVLCIKQSSGELDEILEDEDTVRSTMADMVCAERMLQERLPEQLPPGT